MKHLTRGTAPLVLSAVTLAMLHTSVARAAPLAPDAGQTLRELQQQPSFNAPLAPAMRSDQPPPREDSAAERIAVKAFTINGNSEISSADLQAQLAGLAGTQLSLAELNAAANRITAYYRQRGFAVARAYLPAQDIVDGVVAISVIEGRIDKHNVANRSRLSDARAGAFFDGIKDGDVIRADSVDRSLLLLNDTPGVGSSRATLQPGASVGTSDLLVELTPGQAFAGSVGFDNYGNRYTGEYRLSGTVSANSPLGIGDQLQASALTSGADLNYGRIAYQLPLGSNGLRIGSAYFEAHYKLGREFELLAAHGIARSASGFATYPFIRSQITNLTGIVTLEQKMLTDQVDSTSTRTDKKLRLVNLGLSGNRRDGLNGGGITSVDLAVIHGKLQIGSPSALAIDDASARSNGSYTRMTYALNRLQRLTDRQVLALSWSGQVAGKNLDSSEKFALGGINGVRAYPQGEGIGDEGYLVTLELRHNFADYLQGTLFYDSGEVTYNHDRFGPPASNGRRLAGAGIGLNASMAGVQAKAVLAWPTTGGDATSIPASAARTPTFWLQLGKFF